MTKDPLLKGALIEREAFLDKLSSDLDQVGKRIEQPILWQYIYDLRKWVKGRSKRYNKYPGGLGRTKKK